MAESFKISKSEGEAGGGENLEFGRSYSEKLQTAGRQLVSSLYMLVRSVKLYDPDNAIFNKPLTAMQDTINLIIAMEGKLELQGLRDSFYLNNMLIKVDVNSLDNLRYLQAEMQAKDVGGFTLVRPIGPQELKNFISIFAKDQQNQVEEDGLAGKKLVQMKVTKFSSIKEKLDKDNLAEPDEQKVDRKKYALTLYARAIFFMDDHLKRMLEGTPTAPGKAARLVQDLIEITYEFPNQFLGMTGNGDGDQNLSYHLVNTTLLAIVFGGEIGLSKHQLKELGLSALFNEAVLAKLPPEYRLCLQPQRLPPQIQAMRIQLFHEAAQQALAEPNAGKLQYLRALSAIQMNQPYGEPIRDARGGIRMVMPKGDPLYFSRILAIASYYDMLTSNAADHQAYGPEIALELMWNHERWRFDPELLRAFIAVMGRQPVKMLAKHQRSIDIAGV
ncbi:MAG TPA: hypothetical protein DFS52_10065 [Myxococcales bacterium]|nr:hypothetical protein [Myxococcales bacterium]